LIEKDSFIDKEAFKRRETKNIKGDLYIPMLPEKINNGIASLS
jgi:exoribonuclease R